MTSDIVPSGTGVASRAPERVGLARNDFLRIRELDRRVLAGQSEAQAWAEIVTDPAIGIKPYRGKSSIDVQASARLLSAFLARVAPAELAESRSRVARSAAVFAPKAWARVESLVSGDFGAGKVKMQDGAVVGVGIDAAAAGVQLAAAKFALQTVGLGAKDNGAASTSAATFTGPTNVVFSFAASQKARANGSA